MSPNKQAELKLKINRSNQAMLNSGVVFHYFHDLKKYKKCQGSLSAEIFEEVLDFIQDKYKILAPDEWLFKYNKDTLHYNEILLTFDGGLKSQYEIAYKVLKSRNIKAAYFIYTAPITGQYPVVELCHDFRFSMYENVDEFYEEYFTELVNSKLINDLSEIQERVDKERYLSWGAFYTHNDRTFKYIRDNILTDDEYIEIIHMMMNKKGYMSSGRIDELWLNKADINKLCNDGNIVGSHSHSHPSRMTKLSRDEQKKEYLISKQILEEISGTKVNSMSHPSNSYNESIFEVLTECGYEFGFCNGKADTNSHFLMQRVDHADIIRNMK